MKFIARSYCSTVLNLIDWTPLKNKVSVCTQQTQGGEAKKKKTVPIVPPGGLCHCACYAIVQTVQQWWKYVVMGSRVR